MTRVGRPTLHDTERLLDVAEALAAERGPSGVTMAGVARAAGAPSGSLYHRFENRTVLLGEVWLRVVMRFQLGFLEALTIEPAVEAGVAAARHVIGWIRGHEAETRILLRGPGEFGEADWPPELRARVDARQRELEAALRRMAERLPGRRTDALERVMLATVDIPRAAGRRHLRPESATVPAGIEPLVEECVRALLEPR